MYESDRAARQGWIESEARKYDDTQEKRKIRARGGKERGWSKEENPCEREKTKALEKEEHQSMRKRSKNV